MDDKDFYLMFGRLEGKVDAILSKQERTETRLDNHEKRLGSIEKDQTTRTGFFKAVNLAWLGVSGVFAIAIQYVFKVYL